MNSARRQFMKIAGISAAGLAAALGGTGILVPGRSGASEYKDTEKGLKARRWGMAIFTKKFNTWEDFAKIAEACHKPHNVPKIEGKKEVKWIWPDTYTRGFTESVPQYPSDDAKNRRYLLLCNHCDNPACVRVCPTGATFKREDGIVAMDYHRCIGCRFCMAGCPYGARSFNFYNPREYIAEQNPRFPTRMRGVVEKCTFCSERLAEGIQPYCVEAAKGAIVFGDIMDPSSDISKVLQANYSVVRKPSLGTGPSVYYII